MPKKIFYYFILIILATCYLLLNTSYSYAQSVSLGVYPPILQVMIQPGKSLTQVYKVYNSADPIIVSSSIHPFAPLGETGDITLVDCQKIEVIGCESLSWFSFQNANLELSKSFFLGSGRNQELVLKISVPDYAAEGDYYNTLLFTSQAPPQEGEKTSRAQASIGSNILITVSKDGNPNRTIEISEFSAKKKFSILGLEFNLPLFDSFDLIPILLKLSNIGNAYTSISGKIALTGFPGLISKFTVPPQNILAQGSRIVLATPSASLSNNNNSSLLLPKGFYLGRYKLETEIESEQGQVVKKTTSFYALPFKSVTFLIVFIIFVALLSAIYRKVKNDTIV